MTVCVEKQDYFWFNLFLEVIFRVYCADHTYCTLRFPLSTSAETVKVSAADKLGLKHDDLILVEVKSSGN
jgi:hypothetical protein